MFIIIFIDNYAEVRWSWVPPIDNLRIETSYIMADDESAVLNLATVSELFSQCMTDDNDVLLDPYINAYSELYR